MNQIFGNLNGGKVNMWSESLEVLNSYKALLESYKKNKRRTKP